MSASRATMVLEAIETYLRTDQTEILGGASLTLEHIMPKSWQKNWPAESENDEQDDRTQQQTIEEIGNLTLVTDKLNANLSNDEWSKKRKTLEKHTSLRLNWQLLSEAPPVWDKASIQERSANLTEIAIKIWPAQSHFTQQP